jgi:hypothetical protein
MAEEAFHHFDGLLGTEVERDCTLELNELIKPDATLHDLEIPFNKDEICIVYLGSEYSKIAIITVEQARIILIFFYFHLYMSHLNFLLQVWGKQVSDAPESTSTVYGKSEAACLSLYRSSAC